MSEIDILAIRDGLNELPFREGRRLFFIGRISEKVPLPKVDPTNEVEDENEDENEGAESPPGDRPEVVAFLEQLESELGLHHLTLLRGLEDRDELYAVQQLRSESELDYSWMAEGMRWVSRITTVSLEMVLPAVVGMWFDNRLGTSHWALVGLLFGVPLGFWHLILWTRET